MKLPGRAAQMHVLEVLMVATLFTSAVNVAVVSLPSSDATRVGATTCTIRGCSFYRYLTSGRMKNGDSMLAKLAQ